MMWICHADFAQNSGGRLSSNVNLGKRKDKAPCILKIDAALAYRQGIKFYQGNDKIVLADIIPAKYIEAVSDLTSNVSA